jgi:hypothetical protein
LGFRPGSTRGGAAVFGTWGGGGMKSMEFILL